MGRLTHLLVVAALAGAALVVVGGGQVASGQTGPVGYTSGANIRGVGQCGFFAIDLPTGEATQVTANQDQPCLDGHTFAADGTLYAVANAPTGGDPLADLVTVDPATGAQTEVGELPPVSVGALGMTFDVAGNLWLYGRIGGVDPDCTGSCLWLVDPTDGTTTFVAQSEGDPVFALAATCDGDVLALTGSLDNGPPSSNTSLQLVDTATAGLVPVVDIPNMFFPEGLDHDDAGQLWALHGSLLTGIGIPQVSLVDPATGDFTANDVTIGVEPFFGIMFGLAVSPLSCEVPPPPEPAPDAVVIQPTFTG